MFGSGDKWWWDQGCFNLLVSRVRVQWGRKRSGIVCEGEELELTYGYQLDQASLVILVPVLLYQYIHYSTRL